MNASIMATEGMSVSGQGRAMRRLALVTLISLVVGVLCSMIAWRVHPETVLSASIAAGMTWILCTSMGCWLVWKIQREPDAVLRAWLAMAIAHFAIVAGGSLALIMLAGFHPAATLLSSFATCFVFVYGGAWMVSALGTKRPSAFCEKGAR